VLNVRWYVPAGVPAGWQYGSFGAHVALPAGFTDPLFQIGVGLASFVVVCAALPLLVHFTMVPTVTVSVSGENR